MIVSEMHIAFKLGLDKTESLQYPSFLPEEIDFWLNQAIRKFVKTRYSGFNVKHEGFEQSQKRIDDLRTLVRELTIPCTSTGSVKPNSYVLTNGFNNVLFYTAPYWLSLGEEVLIHYVPTTMAPITVPNAGLVPSDVYKVVGGSITHNSVSISDGTFFIATTNSYTGVGHCVQTTSKRVGVTGATSNDYRWKIDDPTAAHILHYDEARPLRLFYNNTIEFITDNNYLIDDSYIRYIKQPLVVNYTAVTNVASGNIEMAKTYVAVGGSITYPVGGTTYTAGQTFIGLEGLSTFTAVGGATVNLLMSSSDLAEVTHDEIVAIAIQMALENVEQPRLQSYSQSVNTME
jgi:hypothetical protein